MERRLHDRAGTLRAAQPPVGVPFELPALHRQRLLVSGAGVFLVDSANVVAPEARVWQAVLMSVGGFAVRFIARGSVGRRTAIRRRCGRLVARTRIGNGSIGDSGDSSSSDTWDARVLAVIESASRASGASRTSCSTESATRPSCPDAGRRAAAGSRALCAPHPWSGPRGLWPGVTSGR